MKRKQKHEETIAEKQSEPVKCVHFWDITTCCATPLDQELTPRKDNISSQQDRRHMGGTALLVF